MYKKGEYFGFSAAFVESDIKPGDIEFLGPFENLFKFIKWEDEEPTLVKDALDKVEY